MLYFRLVLSFLSFSFLPSLFADQKQWQNHQIIHLVYSDLKANRLELDSQLHLIVDNSSSPLFIKTPKPFKEVKISGKLKITKAITDFENDSYFALGFVYEGDVKPNYFQRLMLPEWLITLTKLNKEKGIGGVDFFESTPHGKKIETQRDFHGIQLSQKTLSHFEKDGSFSMTIPNQRPEQILALWLRSDGDESHAHFQVIIDQIEITPKN